MKLLNKTVALTALVALLGTNSFAHAVTINTGGYGYQESRRAPIIGPVLALATCALVFVIVIALQKQDGGHGHSSSSSSSSS